MSEQPERARSLVEPRNRWSDTEQTTYRDHSVKMFDNTLHIQ